LGIGDWAQSPIPNPQSPIPNPQSPIINNLLLFSKFLFINVFFNIFNLTNNENEDLINKKEIWKFLSNISILIY
jgi:hypothetical protein